MDYGRIAHPEKLKYSLPPDDALNKFSLSPKPHSEFFAYVGAPSWANRDWNGNVYPAKIKAAETLKAYSSQFNSIELNSTYHALPSTSTVEKWRQAVPPHFRFFPKFPSEISHTLRLQSTSEKTQDFLKSMSLLEKNLGRAFLQMAPSFGFENVALLAEFLQSCPAEFPICVELRNSGWLTPHQTLRPSVFELFQKHSITPALVDTPGHREVLHASLPVPQLMVRFLASDIPEVDTARLEQWAMRIAHWKQQGLREVAWFNHSHNLCYVASLCNQMVSLLNQHCHTNLLPWAQASAPSELTLF